MATILLVQTPTKEIAPTPEPQIQPTAMSVPPASTTPVLDVTAAAVAAPSPALPEPETAAPDPVQQADIIDFILPDVTVAAGATVEWIILDSSAHTATRGVDGIYDRAG